MSTLSAQATDHREDLIRRLRAAQSHGIHSLDQSAQTRIFEAQVAVGDWNRNHAEDSISKMDVELPQPPSGLVVAFEL